MVNHPFWCVFANSKFVNMSSFPLRGRWTWLTTRYGLCFSNLNRYVAPVRGGWPYSVGEPRAGCDHFCLGRSTLVLPNGLRALSNVILALCSQWSLYPGESACHGWQFLSRNVQMKLCRDTHVLGTCHSYTFHPSGPTKIKWIICGYYGAIERRSSSTLHTST